MHIHVHTYTEVKQPTGALLRSSDTPGVCTAAPRLSARMLAFTWHIPPVVHSMRIQPGDVINNAYSTTCIAQENTKERPARQQSSETSSCPAAPQTAVATERRPEQPLPKKCTVAAREKRIPAIAAGV